MAEDVSLIPVYAALGGAFLGAVATYFPTYWMERYKEKKESRMITEAIMTEIAGLLSLMQRRGYVAHLEKIICDLRTGRKESSNFQIIFSDDICIIFKKNIEKIGILPHEIRKDVVYFYQLIDAIICDVKPGGFMAEQRGEKEFGNVLNLAKEIQAVGDHVLTRYQRRKASRLRAA